MEIKLKINVDKILAETGITIDEPEQWLALMQTASIISSFIIRT